MASAASLSSDSLGLTGSESLAGSPGRRWKPSAFPTCKAAMSPIFPWSFWIVRVKRESSVRLHVLATSCTEPDDVESAVGDDAAVASTWTLAWSYINAPLTSSGQRFTRQVPGCEIAGGAQAVVTNRIGTTTHGQVNDGGDINGTSQGGSPAGVQICRRDESLVRDSVLTEAILVILPIDQCINETVEAMAGGGIEQSINFPSPKRGSPKKSAMHHFDGLRDVQTLP